MRDIYTDLNLLITPVEWRAVLNALPGKLTSAGYEPSDIHAEIVDLTCEPDNMLVTQFAQTEGHAPVVETLHRVIVNGRSDLELRQATQALVGALPENAYWYGTSNEGRQDPGIAASCAWQDRA